jgi:hypothetical protein
VRVSAAQQAEVRLNELDKDEMWDVARVLKPGVTREEFEEMWAEFCEMKDEHERRKALS